MQAMIEIFIYFTEAGRGEEEAARPTTWSRCSPRLEVDGKPIPPMDVLAFCLIIVIAGNETTRNGTSGGMLAFVEHQDELRKLQRDPSPAAVGRWRRSCAGPARSSTSRAPRRRTSSCAASASSRATRSRCSTRRANRDEEVFEDPFAFRIDRAPEPPPRLRRRRALLPRLARGAARAAGRLQAPVPRIEEIELAGPGRAPALEPGGRREAAAAPLQAEARGGVEPP